MVLSVFSHSCPFQSTWIVFFLSNHNNLSQSKGNSTLFFWQCFDSFLHILWRHVDFSNLIYRCVIHSKVTFHGAGRPGNCSTLNGNCISCEMGARLEKGRLWQDEWYFYDFFLEQVFFFCKINLNLLNLLSTFFIAKSTSTTFSKSSVSDSNTF